MEEFNSAVFEENELEFWSVSLATAILPLLVSQDFNFIVKDK